MMTIIEQFQQAIAASKTLIEKPDNETLLKLYALFKQGSEGDAADEDSSSMFDFVAKAKYNAWVLLKGTTKEAAQKSYIDLVTKLKA